MKKNYIKKELSLEDLINRKTEKPSEQVPRAIKAPEISTKEAEPKKEQIEKIETKLSETDKYQIKEKMSTRSAASLPIQQLPKDVQDEIKNIENILQEGLEETYKTMDPVSQMQFKTQGEDTARAINILFNKTKVKIKEIVDLIIKWLKIIPGLNKFFAEQEAKIKADKLLARKRKQDEEKLK